MSKIYTIGDIHGEHGKLDLLLEILYDKLNEEPESKAVFLGDYINKGRNSLKVLDSLILFKKTFPEQVVFLRGNHEQVLIEALNGHNFSGSLHKKIFEFYCTEFIKDGLPYIKSEHEKFLNETKLSYCENRVLFIHAGIDKHGQQCLWSYGILGKLPDGIDMVIRGHDIREDVTFYSNNIAIDTGAYRKDGKLSCLVFDIDSKLSVGRYSVFNNHITYTYRALKMKKYDGPWYLSDCIDVNKEMQLLKNKLKVHINETKLIKLFQDRRNYFSSVNTFKVVDFEHIIKEVSID